ncbi:MAG TPA: hypothetical protein PKA74_04840 [Bauldia sp.]|nr:hypothetical protein [Bauldia sp.]
MQPARLDAVMRFLFRPDGRIARQEFVLGIGLVLAVFAAFNVPLWREDPPAVLAVLAFMAAPAARTLPCPPPFPPRRRMPSPS